MIADFAGQIKDRQVYVAEYQSLLAGYVVFYPNQDHIHLENIAVRPSLAGQGIGKKLFNYVEQAASEKGFKTIELYTNEAMTENLDMYPRLGYVEIDRHQQDGFNRVFFRKLL